MKYALIGAVLADARCVGESRCQRCTFEGCREFDRCIGGDIQHLVRRARTRPQLQVDCSAGLVDVCDLVVLTGCVGDVR